MYFNTYSRPPTSVEINISYAAYPGAIQPLSTTAMEKAQVIKLLQASADPDSISQFCLVDHEHIKYVTVDPYIFDEMDLIFEPTLIEILRPLLPAGDWNHARIFRATSLEKSSTGNAEVQVETSIQVLPEILAIWHSLTIDYLELKVGRCLRSNVCEATCSKIPGQFIVKFA
jgi:hypothetical protein